MRRLARAAAASAVATVILAAGGVVRVKLYAVFLGASGLGVISQIQSLLNALAVLAMLGTGVGISREVARARGGAGAAASPPTVLATARLLAGGTALLLAGGMVLAAEPLSRLLLGARDYRLLVGLAAPVLLFTILARLTTEALNGYGDYRRNAVGMIASAALSVSFALPLLWMLQLPGAVLALLLGSAGTWGVVHMLFRWGHPDAAGRGARPDRDTARTLVRLGGVSLAIATADQLALLTVRSRLIHLHGVEANGLFQGVWGLYTSCRRPWGSCRPTLSPACTGRGIRRWSARRPTSRCA